MLHHTFWPRGFYWIGPFLCITMLALLVITLPAGHSFAIPPDDDPFGSDSTEEQPSEPSRIAADDPDLEILLESDGRPEAEEQAVALWRQALGGDQFDRSAPTVLQGLLQQHRHPTKELVPPVAPQEPDQEQKEKPKQKQKQKQEEAQPGKKLSPLGMQVVTGNWPLLKELLHRLPVEQSRPAYAALLATLRSNPAALILPQDAVALADLAPPGSLADRELAELGLLLKRSLQQSERPGAFIAAVKSGKLRLAKDDLAHAVATTKLLLAAGLADESTEFLPSLDPNDTGDVEKLSLHARYQYLLGRRHKDVRALAKSWQLTLAVLALPESGKLPRAAAVRRVLALVLDMPRDVVAAWLDGTFRTNPELALILLADVCERQSSAFQSMEPRARQNALRLQQLVGTPLLSEIDNDPSRWSLALAMNTSGWINEAQKAVGGKVRKMVIPNDERIPALEARQVLDVAPHPRWRAALPADTSQHVQHMIGLLSVHVGDEEGALVSIREMASSSPQRAQEVSEELVRGLGVPRDVNQDFSDMHQFQSLQRQVRYGQNRRHYRGSSSQQVVTRAGQLRNLTKLTELLATIKAAGVATLREEAIVQAFATCHSHSEVYREEDIARVFGELDQVGASVAVELGNALRSGLASQWRDARVQQQLGTKRSPAEQVAELVRGYELALRLLDSAVQRAPQRVDLRLLLAGMLHDEAEFLYAQQVDLETYVRIRDAAFRQFQGAAEVYSAGVAALEPALYNVAAYQLWFQATLGSSEMAYLSLQDKPERSQVAAISAALKSLPEAAREKHRELFTASLTAAMDEVPPVLKTQVVRHALEVIGDHPDARQLRQRLAYYDELLQETALRLEVDGEDRVGHGRPFGVHVSLVATGAVMRENDGFNLLLQQPGNQYGNSAAGQPRKALEQDLREKLSPTYLIESLVFHAPPTRPRASGRPGWQSLPVAYAVLRAKDASIDRLAPIQFDWDFADGGSEVRLPIRSDEVLIDCRDETPPQRPAHDVTIRQLLDDRQSGDGVIRLEVQATAHGLVPELGQLLADGGSAVPGLRIQRVAEQELSISALESGERVEPVSERRWLLEWSPDPESPPADFRFPAAATDTFATTYQRYTDADIVECQQLARLRWPALHGARRWVSTTAIGVTLALAGVVIVYLLRRRTVGQVGEPAYRDPVRLTPFSLMTLLRRIQHDPSLALSAAERTQLDETLDQLEDRYFVRGATNHESDLQSICRHWVRRASKPGVRRFD